MSDNITNDNNDNIEENEVINSPLDELNDEEFIEKYSSLSTQSSDNSTQEKQEDTGNNDNTENSDDVKEEDTTSKEVDEKPVEKNIEEQEDTTDYKSLYLSALNPLKATGKEISIQSIDELRSFAQKGIDYTKKTQEIKPHLKIIKALENNGVLEPDKVNFMIDLIKGDRAALLKHIKDSGIDPLEIDIENNNTYNGRNYIPSDESFDFQENINTLYQSTEGRLVLDTIKDWDDFSKNEVINIPNVLPFLVNQAKTGEFQEIMAEVEKERLLHNLTQPIGHIYNAIYQKRKQIANNQKELSNTNDNSNFEKKVIDVRTKVIDVKKAQETNDKINKLASVKTVPSEKKTVPSMKDILELDDDAFMKQMKQMRR